MRIRLLRILTLSVSSFLFSFPTPLDSSPAPLRPGTRVLLDAHNCYPYYEWWFDRIDRALSAGDRKSTRLNSSHSHISYAVFCLKNKSHGDRSSGNGNRTQYLQVESMRHSIMVGSSDNTCVVRVAAGSFQ